MSDFQVGDIVKRVYGGSIGKVIIGQTYVVSEVISKSEIALKNTGSHRWNKDNFALVKRANSPDTDSDSIKVSAIRSFSVEIRGTKHNLSEEDVVYLYDQLSSILYP